MSSISTNAVLRRVCKAAKICSLGDYWYQNPQDSSLKYRVMQTTTLFLYSCVALSEILEIICDTYPTDLHNDAAALGMATVVLFIRMYSIMYKKDDIRELHRFIAEECTGYEDDKILTKQYKKIKRSIIMQSSICYCTIPFYVIEGFRRMIYDGAPFLVFPGYFPSYDDDSNFALAFRVVTFIVTMVMATTMISTDTLAISHLIILSCKFENLREYFKRLRKDFMSQEVSISELKQKCIDGVILHQKLISIKDKLHNCFGVMMSIEVFQGSLLAVLLLLRVALLPQITFNVLMMVGGFMMTVMSQLAWYMWNAGDITYQASLISEAIFHCGWEARGVGGEGRDVRRLVLLGCAQAQRPLVFKAFGMQDVSYQSFVMVIRASYSLFAVLH